MGAKKQTLSNHDVLARNKERISFSLFLLVLIMSISTHLFIHLTTQKKKMKNVNVQVSFLIKDIWAGGKGHMPLTLWELHTKKY
jgi:hypothetical protein